MKPLTKEDLLFNKEEYFYHKIELLGLDDIKSAVELLKSKLDKDNTDHDWFEARINECFPIFKEEKNE